MNTQTRRWVLARRPHGIVQPDDFRIETVLLGKLQPGRVHVRAVAFGNAPAMREWMDEHSEGTAPSILVGEPLRGGAVAVVVRSAHSEFREGDLVTGVISAIPYLVAAVTMVLIGRHADRHNERRWHIAGCCLLAAAAIIGVTRAHSTGTVIPALAVGAIGIWGTLGPFWALATRFLRGGAAAGGIAIVNSLGNLAGFVAPYAIGWVKGHTGGFGGMLFVSAALACGAVLVLCVPPTVDRSTA